MSAGTAGDKADDPDYSAVRFVPGRTLTPEELRRAGEALFGAWGWQTRLAETLEVDGSTVRRWVSGAVAVPPPVKVAIRLLLERREQHRPPAAPADKKPMRRRSTGSTVKSASASAR